MINEVISGNSDKILKKVIQDDRIYIKQIRWNLMTIATKKEHGIFKQRYHEN